MTPTRETTLADMDLYHTRINQYKNYAVNYTEDAETHWNLNQDHLAIEDILKALAWITTSLGYCAGIYEEYAPKGIVPYFLRNFTGEADELTAKAICEAWAKDDFTGRGITIAFIDRMRQLLWDEPFYVKWGARQEQADK